MSTKEHDFKIRAEYHQTTIWWKKALLIHLYHSSQKVLDRKWNITKTARDLGVSIGLVSEDLRLAELIQTDDSIKTIYKSRLDALSILKKVKVKVYE